jgi:cytochrome b561
MVQNTSSSWGSVSRAWHHFVKRDRVAARMVDGASG